MDCPKCNASMTERSVEVLQGKIVIDQCTGCKGLWFDLGEAEQLKKSWMSDFLDTGDPKIGKTYNRVRDIHCPRCGKGMSKLTDKRQPHMVYEACEEHGMFMDAGEFTDNKHETLMDFFRGLIATIKRV